METPVSQSKNNLFPGIETAFVFLVLLGSATAGFAQQSVVEDAGGGRKTEQDYDASDRVIQQRTVDADGKVMEKIDYEYVPGHIGPQQTSTAYWPNGKVRKITLVTYDESSNFTGEFIRIFDESEIQVAGHNLTHNPWNGVYTCADWNVAEQAYKSTECPSGEESSGAAKKERKFSRQEVVQALNAARKNAQRPTKEMSMHPFAPVPQPTTAASPEVGIVVPAQIRAGERVSGIVTRDASKYDGMPEVSVMRLAVPFEATGEASRLSGWNFETEGEPPQAAEGPITFIAPRGDSGLKVTFRQAGNPGHSIGKVLHFPRNSTSASPSRSFQAPALCMKGTLCMVRGPFSGDSRKTFAAFEQRPATIVAETTEAAYVDIPELTEPGSRPLFIAEGAKVVALPLVVGRFFIKNIGRQLQAGQTLIVFPTLDGPADIPDELWRAGDYSEASLDQARQIVPGYQIHHGDNDRNQDQDARKISEAQTEQDAKEKKGEIVLIVKNEAPEHISLRGSKDQALIFHLNDESFQRGEFKYDLVVEAHKSGPVRVKGYIITFLEPVTGQEFDVKTPGSGQ
jgi:YD repeat-containing protein